MTGKAASETFTGLSGITDSGVCGEFLFMRQWASEKARYNMVSMSSN